MSKFYEALVRFEREINQYAEDGHNIVEVILKESSYNKIRWVIAKELSLNWSMTSDNDAFGFEGLASAKPYFKCRGIKFSRER